MAPANSSTLVSWLAYARKQLFTIGVLAVLVGIGMWGHANHWQFAPQHAEAHLPGHDLSLDSSKSDSAQAALTTRVQFASPEAVSQLGMETVVAEPRPIAQEVGSAGVVVYEPTRLAQLSARVPGTVWRVEKQVGQPIRAGDVLAVIDAPALGQAKADFLRSIADVQLCKLVYGRFQSFTAGEVPAKEVQQTQTALRKARVDLFNAQQALISLGLKIDLEEWEALSETELQSRIKFLGLSEAIVSQLDPNSTTASLLPVYAPFNGLVIGRDLAIGEAVSPTHSHFEIADVSKMWIVLNVRESDAEKLELGQTVVFTAGNATVTSIISWMSTAVDEKTRTVEVRCECDNPEIMSDDGKPTGKRLLRANLFGVGKVRVQENPSAITVPTRAVQWDGQAHVLFVPFDERSFEARRVQVGAANGEYTEILAGVAAGEQVVVVGSHILKAELQRQAISRPP